MFAPRVARTALGILPLLLPLPVAAQWRPVAPGIDYRAFDLPGPVRAFAARADRKRDHWTIDAAIDPGGVRSGLETVSKMAERYDNAVTLSGDVYDVKVAVNGDYFSFQTHQPPGGQITGGWFAKRYGDFTGGSGFVWRLDRSCFLGGNVTHRRQKIRFADGTEMRVGNVNAPRGADDLVVYTPPYAEHTHTDAGGVEVLVRLNRPLMPMSDPGGVGGTVVRVRENAGATPIPFDGAVLSGSGSAAKTLRERAKPGETVEFQLEIQDHGHEEAGLPKQDWSKAYASVGGHFYLVIDGKVPSRLWLDNKGAVIRNPRTAVAFNDRHVFFVVVDGRSKQSIGMTIAELGEFCRGSLGATQAIAQDGGGSSAMWVDGKVMNVPSDGRERAVANGYLMALTAKARRSAAFAAGQNVAAREGAEVRLGPGTNHAVLATAPKERVGTVADHPLNGVQAKGAFWWKWAYGDVEGWTRQEFLARAP